MLFRSQIIIITIVIIICIATRFIDYDVFAPFSLSHIILLIIAISSIVLGFYVFIDMNYSIQCTSIILFIISMLITEVWAFLCTIKSKNPHYEINVNIGWGIFFYLMFLYNRWKAHK